MVGAGGLKYLISNQVITAMLEPDQFLTPISELVMNYDQVTLQKKNALKAFKMNYQEQFTLQLSK